MLRLFILLCALSPFSVYAELKIFACEADWAALAQELGGDKVEIYQATNGTQDVHHIEARPSLLAQTRQADLLVCTGAELEIGWLPVILSKTGNAKIQPGAPGYFMAAEFVALKDRHAEVDRSAGDIHAAGNPHFQTDPRYIAQVAAALAQRLQQLDPVNSADYQARHADFAQRWDAAMDTWQQRAAPLKNLKIVVYHDAWGYLQDWLGLEKVAVLEPKPGIPPSSGHLADVLRTVQGNPARAVIYASYEDPKAPRWLAEKANIPALELPNSVGGSDTATDLFSLFDSIISQLLSAP